MIRYDKSTKVKFSLLLGLWFLAFSPVYPSLVNTWLNSSDNSHGILVPLIAVYFMWRKKNDLALSPISSSGWGEVLLILSMALYLLGYAGKIAVVSRSMIVFSLMGLVLFCLGKRCFMHLAFSLSFLLFMVPVPDSILGLVAFPLQLYATKISVLVIEFFSIPAYREGNMVYFAKTQLEVAEACSGVHSLVSLTMLSVIFAHLCKNGPILKVILLVSAPILALLTNICRVSGTGILAHFYGDKVARGFLHEFSGIVTFFLGLALFTFEYLVLNRIANYRPLHPGRK